MICGKKTQWIICEDDKVFYTGTSVDFALPDNNTKNTLTAFKLSNDETFSEKIVHISAGNHYELFVTDKGKLYGMGNRLLKKLGLESETPIHIPMKDEAQVKRTWCSNATELPCIIVEVVNKDGNLQLFSAGKNEQGLLGQGNKIKDTKLFAPLSYDCTKTTFKQVSLFADFAMAID